MEDLLKQLGLGSMEIDLARAVRYANPEVDALCAYSGDLLPHGQESAHRRWMEDAIRLERELEHLEQEARARRNALGALLQELEGNEPDWEHPQVRNEMKRRMSPFFGIGSIISGPSTRHALPKLADRLHHGFIAFIGGQMELQHMNRVNQSKADSIICEHILQLRRNRALAPESATSSRFREPYFWCSIPKHINGRKTYAVVHTRGIARHGGLFRSVQIWIPTPEGWQRAE